MAKIIAPVKFTGIRAGILFVNGVANTENEWLMQWFKTHGYAVETDVPEEATEEKGTFSTFENLSVEELTVYAVENGINIGRATTHEGILKKILEVTDKSE